MKRVFQALALVGLAAMTVACSSGGSSSTPAATAAASGDTSSPAGSPAAGGRTIVAKDIAFNPTTVTIPADTAKTVPFTEAIESRVRTWRWPRRCLAALTMMSPRWR